MTDEQIIKAMESAIHRYKDVTHYVSCIVDINILKNALDLINRQKEEIEQWKEKANKYQNLWGIALDDIEIEKTKTYTRITNIKKISRYLNDLVKEMMEVNKNENQN